MHVRTCSRPFWLQRTRQGRAIAHNRMKHQRPSPVEPGLADDFECTTSGVSHDQKWQLRLCRNSIGHGASPLPLTGDSVPISV